MFVINAENLRKASKCVFYIVSLVLPTIILLYIHVIGMYGIISLSIDTYITLASVDIHFFSFKTSIDTESVTINYFKPEPYYVYCYKQ